ncbi:HtaA domain-containing protein [Phenylobacterium sp.]|uniref:HtaA domain-containing protein n=1 Tax=Phenylobacterium sp. TaxID=1871053 RepID=UPI0027328830|nr:HtaA domain-containing protein [Phenylobacterium sp.]MDP3855388.1 HtaA domain-containing protein [Phenylobacterium sp.]
MTEPQQATLNWGVKQSFRNYVEATGGVTEAGGGAERAPDGEFIFAAAPGDGLRLDADGKLEGHGTFLGEVRFEAHGGMLSVFLADPSLEISEAGAVLTVADSSARTRRVEIARLDLSAMTTGDAGEIVLPAALSMDGIQLLGDHYPLRTALDPVRLTLAER